VHLAIPELVSCISCFQRVLEARFPVGAKDVIVAIREIYATRFANSVLSTASRFFQCEIVTACEGEKIRDECRLPLPQVVSAVAPRLIEAVENRSVHDTVVLLNDIGILSLCLPREINLNCLAVSARSVVGRRRLVPLVELAVLSSELGFDERASADLREALALSPGSPELHDLHTVAGIIALNRGNLADAKNHLAESVRACLVDDDSCLLCMRRSPNWSLAERLLERGELAAVTHYLRHCQTVWIRDGGQIGVFIEEIEKNRNPDFSKLVGPLALRNEPLFKMKRLIMRSEYLGESGANSPKEGTRLGIESILREFIEFTEAAIKGRLESNKN
jgi:hypothetical protein